LPDQSLTPLVLAVDTTREHGSLALMRGAELLEEAPLHSPSGFAHVIYGHLDGLLRRNRVELAAVDCYAAASGPGSFTGVRVGLACVKGLAEAAGKPAVAVSNLEALASFGASPLRAPLLDARRGEIYGAVYDRESRLVVPETVAPLTRWLAALPSLELEFISPDFGDWGHLLPGPRTVAPPSIAAAVAAIALRRFLSGEALDPAALDANYVRRSDAELFWVG
jgi:tRNA threonylcarbamoyladenosine biosynthesis protein TsaB